jgi:hypothetical protein
MWLLAFSFFVFLYTCHVFSLYPLASIINVLYCTPTMSFISSMRHSKHFSIFDLDVQRIFKYVVIIVKQSCGQSKQVYILTDVYFNNWIGDYTYWMYLIWCIFHPVKTSG